MADFVAVLRKTIDGLADNTPAMRGKVYDKARSTVAAKLAAINPPPPVAVADRQKQVLEDAIRQVEAGYSGAGDPFAELENVFAAPAKKEQPATTRPSRSLEARMPPAAPVRSPTTLPPLPGSPAGQSRWTETPPAIEAQPMATERPDVPFDGEDDVAEEVADEVAEGAGGLEEPMRRQRSFVPLIAAVVALLLVLGGAYTVWLNKDDFMAMLGIGGKQTVASAPAAGDTAPVSPPVGIASKSSNNEDQVQEPPKFTQRLNSDGTEVDPGPAGGIKSIGEGTSVAAATQQPQPPQPAAATDTTTTGPATPPADASAAATPPADASAAATPPADASAAATPPADASAAATPPADASAAATDPAAGTPPATGTTLAAGAAPTATAGAGPDVAAAAPPTAAAAGTADGDAQVAVGQKAIFYEERTNVAAGSAEAGNIVWSLVQESPGDGQPAEPAIHGEATIPGKDIQLRVTIRRNVDKTLPASHIIELIFLTPADFDGGGIDKVLRFALKDTEEDAGSALLAIPPTKVGDGYFLVALNDTKAEIETNLTLLKREQWIDVPVVYENGRRALITMEKGIPGDKVFDEVIKSWQAAAASAG